MLEWKPRLVLLLVALTSLALFLSLLRFGLSTGTGKRSVRTMPTNSAATATMSATECGVVTYETPAAQTAATPATQTGATSARTLEGTGVNAFTAPS